MADSQTKPQASGRFEFLDSARGIAAWSVLVYHTIRAYNYEVGDTPLTPWTLATLKVLFNGSEAVSFFFVLSGFVLASSLKDLKGGFYFPNYILRRLFRIYPLYIVAVVVAFFLSADHKLFYLLQELLLTSGVHRLLPPGWTMGIELVLSLLMPVLLLTLRERHVFYGLMVLLLFSYKFVSPFLLHFMLGVWIYDFHRAGQRVAWLDRTGTLLLTLPVCLVLYSVRHVLPVLPRLEYTLNVFQDLIGMDRDIIYFYFSALASSVFLLLILQSARLQDLLSNFILSFIGRISFSLYLLHWIILYAFHFSAMQVYLPTVWILPAMVLIVSMTTIAVSYFTYQFIELPFINLAKRIDLRKWLPVSQV